MSAETGPAYCARLVREADYERYATAMFMPSEHRDAVLALYAFNAEIGRVRGQITQPMAGEIRLQWWTDVLSGKSAPDAAGHPVAAELLRVVGRYRLSAASLSELVAAHRFDLYNEPMQTVAEMEGYLDQTAGKLFMFGARILGATAAWRGSPKPGSQRERAAGRSPPPRTVSLEDLTHHASLAHGLVSLIEAMPRHSARGQLYLPVALLERFGVMRETIFAGGASAELRQLLRFLAAEARTARDEAMRLLAGIDPPSRANFLLLGSIGSRLARLERCGFDPFRLAPPSHLSLLFTCWRSSRRLKRL